MPKQKTMGLPWDYWEALEKYYREKKELFEFIGITSEAELLRVLANFGKPALDQLIEQVRALGKIDLKSMKEKFSEARKSGKD